MIEIITIIITIVIIIETINLIIENVQDPDQDPSLQKKIYTFNGCLKNTTLNNY
jgi:hypothetical protein